MKLHRHSKGKDNLAALNIDMFKLVEFLLIAAEELLRFYPYATIKGKIENQHIDAGIFQKCLTSLTRAIAAISIQNRSNSLKYYFSNKIKNYCYSFFHKPQQ